MVKASVVPEAGTADAVAVQTAPPIATVGSVVVPDESSLEIEHVIRPEPDKSVAVTARVPLTAVMIPLPGVANNIVGNTVIVVVPETPVLSTAVTVTVPAGAIVHTLMTDEDTCCGGNGTYCRSCVCCTQIITYMA